MIPDNIHLKIRAVRKERDFSQEYIANKTGIKQQDVSDIELGEKKVTEELLLKISNALEVTPEYIIAKEYYQPVQIHNTNCSGNVGNNQLVVNNDDKLLNEIKEIFLNIQKENINAFESIIKKLITK